MLVVINSQGKLIAQQQEDLYQGSVNANVLNLIAPFASNVIFKANFELLDGTIMPENLDGYIMHPSISIADGLNSWKLPIDFAITQNYGLITLQLRGYIGSQIICSSTIKLQVQKGVPYNNAVIEPSAYEELLNLITDLKAVVNNKVDIVNYNYIEAENITSDTVGVYYKFDGENYKQVFLPDNFEENVQYYLLETTSKIIHRPDALYFEYNSGTNRLSLVFEKDKVTINDSQVVVFEDLKAKNIVYNNYFTKLDANNLQDAIDIIGNRVDYLDSLKTIELGNFELVPSGWVEDENGFKFEFINELLTDALTQSVIITPSNETIDNLNNENIFVYPQIEVYQKEQDVASAVIRLDKKPTFNFVCNVKLQGLAVNGKSNGIQASQVLFTPNEYVKSKNVQQAIIEVQDNLNNFSNNYNAEKVDFVKLDTNGKVPSSQLPSYVDDVVEAYLFETKMYRDAEHTDLIVAESGKIYIDLHTNKQYRWGGTQYVVISKSLAVGETAGSAYDGAKGKQTTDNVNSIMNGSFTVPFASKSITQDVNDNSTNIATTEFVTNKISTNGEVLWSGVESVSTEPLSLTLNNNLQVDDIIEIDIGLGYTRMIKKIVIDNLYNGYLGEYSNQVTADGEFWEISNSLSFKIVDNVITFDPPVQFLKRYSSGNFNSITQNNTQVTIYSIKKVGS